MLIVCNISRHDSWSGATVTYMPDDLVQLCLTAHCSDRRHNCGSEASVTDIPAGTAPQLQMCLQILQKCMLVIDVPNIRVQLSQTCLLFQSKV